MYFDGESASLLKRRIDQDRLFLLKKEYNPDKETHPGGRKWDNIACKDIWERNNATAYQLMEKAYSKEIAEDFKNSRLIFDGTYAIVTRIGWGHLDVDPTPANFDDAKTWKMINEYPAKVFLGKKYAYRRAYQPNYLYNEVADVPHNIPEKSCTFLSIQSIDRGKQDANILSANQKVYERWSALESNKNNRLKPANISVE